MSKNREAVNYTDEPIELGERVRDFLPSPQELAEADEVVKVTIALSKSSVAFFKQAAEENNSSYQRMIRRLLDEYVQQQEQLTQRLHT
ncbi:MAG: CopG family transcriptional regulator [Caldilineaceae bacterium]|jgi:predicted DNA binding CopG/RHH family protein